MDQDKIIPAMIEAKAELVPAGKTGFNDFHKYKYSREEDWFASVNPVLNKHGLTLTFDVVGVESTIKEKKKGNDTKADYHFLVTGEAILWHTSGQSVRSRCFGEAQDSEDKGLAKALTAMRKAGYSILLGLPTSEDPEAYDTKSKASKPTPEPEDPAMIDDAHRKVEPKKDEAFASPAERAACAKRAKEAVIRASSVETLESLIKTAKKRAAEKLLTEAQSEAIEQFAICKKMVMECDSPDVLNNLVEQFKKNALDHDLKEHLLYCCEVSADTIAVMEAK